MFRRERYNQEESGYSKGGRNRGGKFRRGSHRGNSRERSSNKRCQNHYSQDGKRMKFEVRNRLKEVDVGVTEFLGDHKHISGIFKERFSDFHVHEIAIDGVTARLTTQSIPDDPVVVINYKILEDNTLNKLLTDIETLKNSHSDINSIDFDITNMNKDQRRVVHQVVKQNPLISSETVEKDGKKYLTLTKYNSMKTKTGTQTRSRDNRIDWSQREGIYCHFLIHKINMDTMDVISRLARSSQSEPNRFLYAGTKDRRACTTQWISLKKGDPKRILKAEKRIPGAFVGNFKFAKEPLKLGMLNGNHFTIALRNISATDEEIDKAMTSLQNNGFINYYGLQRFGTVSSIPTHAIGKALLQSKWDEAIDLILKPRIGEREDMSEVREIFAKTKDATEALKHMNRLDKIEAKLLKGIELNGFKNPQGALDFIPRNTRLMYIHSYQSFIWNKIVSRRIHEFGRNPIVGDLVYENSDIKSDTEILDYLQVNDDNDDQEKQNKTLMLNDETEKICDNTNDIESRENMMKIDEIIEIKTAARIENTNKFSLNNNSTENTTKKESDKSKDLLPLPAVKILTEENLKNYSYVDIVMPQPGWRVIYPTYAKIWYEELLAKDGLSVDLKHKNKKYSLSGSYRKIFQVPENLTWKTVNYEKFHDELILSDIDKLKSHDERKYNPDGKYKALILEMSLKSSAYATMALREILEHDTSAETQAAQSAAYLTQHETTNEKIEELKQSEDVTDEVKKMSEKVKNEMELENEKEMTKLPMEIEPI